MEIFCDELYKVIDSKYRKEMECMKNLTLIGKVYLGLGVLFSISGIFLFVQNLNEIFVLKEQFLSFSFVCLGISLFLASYLQQRKRNQQ